MVAGPKPVSMKDTNRNVGVYYQRNLREKLPSPKTKYSVLIYGNSSVEERRALGPEDDVSLTSSRAKKIFTKYLLFRKTFVYLHIFIT